MARKIQRHTPKSLAQRVQLRSEATCRGLKGDGQNFLISFDMSSPRCKLMRMGRMRNYIHGSMWLTMVKHARSTSP